MKIHALYKQVVITVIGRKLAAASCERCGMRIYPALAMEHHFDWHKWNDKRMLEGKIAKEQRPGPGGNRPPY
jgi:hypothetical protein